MVMAYLQVPGNDQKGCTLAQGNMLMYAVQPLLPVTIATEFSATEAVKRWKHVAAQSALKGSTNCTN